MGKKLLISAQSDAKVPMVRCSVIPGAVITRKWKIGKMNVQMYTDDRIKGSRTITEYKSHNFVTYYVPIPEIAFVYR